MNERTIKYINSLTEVIKYLSEMDRKLSEYTPSVSDTVDKYLDGILNSPLPPPTRETVVLQPNRRKKRRNRQSFTQEELQEMPFLKDLKYRITQDGIHQFRYRRDGFNVSFNSKNYDVAKKKALDFIFSIKQKLRSDANNIVKGNSLDQIFNSWIAIKKAHSDPRTADQYICVYKNHIQPFFGKQSIKNILPVDLQPYFDALFERSGRKSEDVRTILNGCFKYAMANRIIPSNPMEGVIIERHIRQTGKALDDATLDRFKQAMLADETRYGLAGLIILYSGIRGGELASMTFDWDAGTFTVKNAKLKKSQKARPENLYRTVPIFPALYALRDRIITEAWKIEPSTLTQKFPQHFSECTVKDLRHTFTTRARECGIDNELVNLWTGHLPGKNVAANIYTHFSIEFQKREAKRLKPY